jgi:hypothetical protein
VNNANSTFVRHRGRWAVFTIVMVPMPLLWPLGFYSAWRLFATRDVMAEIAQADLAAGREWGRASQAGGGMACGQCGKPLSPVWRGACRHCGVAYEVAHPVAAVAQTVLA